MSDERDVDDNDDNVEEDFEELSAAPTVETLTGVRGSGILHVMVDDGSTLS